VTFLADGYRSGTRAVGALPTETVIMIILGIILLIIGFVAAIHIIWILGIVALVIGAVFAIAGVLGHEIGGRRHIY
jgi:uncharacterized membrane protein HdeD (DUF308 family)